MVDLASRKRIEWQVFATYFAEEYACVALACCALRSIEREVAEVVKVLMTLGTCFTCATTAVIFLFFGLGLRSTKFSGGFRRAADGALKEPLFWFASEANVDLLFADAFSHFADGLCFSADNACGDFQREMQSARCTHVRVFCEVCMTSLLPAAATYRSVRCAQIAQFRWQTPFFARSAAFAKTEANA